MSGKEESSEQRTVSRGKISRKDAKAQRRKEKKQRAMSDEQRVASVQVSVSGKKNKFHA